MLLSLILTEEQLTMVLFILLIVLAIAISASTTSAEIRTHR